jgi:hypothetical protein
VIGMGAELLRIAPAGSWPGRQTTNGHPGAKAAGLTGTPTADRGKGTSRFRTTATGHRTGTRFPFRRADVVVVPGGETHARAGERRPGWPRLVSSFVGWKRGVERLSESRVARAALPAECRGLLPRWVRVRWQRSRRAARLAPRLANQLVVVALHAGRWRVAVRLAERGRGLVPCACLFSPFTCGSGWTLIPRPGKGRKGRCADDRVRERERAVAVDRGRRSGSAGLASVRHHGLFSARSF